MLTVRYRFPEIRRKVMDKLAKLVTKRSLMVITIAGLALLLAPMAKASCGSAEAARRVLANKPWSALRSLAQSAAEGVVPESETEDGSEPLIAGLWKTVFVSGGSVVTVGFDSWHSDGTEFALDSLPVLAGTLCPGTWEKQGRRTFSTVHPAYNYDPVTGNPNSVFIERVHITLSKDGKSFAGTFTWDCYDFSGNLQTAGPLACSITGTLTGTRITVDGPFPFPFPL
jgi:hypothetical protein